MPEGFLADGIVDLNGVRLRLLDVFGQVSEAHVALAQECVVHGEGCGEAVVCVSTVFLGIAQEVLQQGTVVGMSYADDFLCLLHIRLVAQVGYAVLCDDGIYKVVRVVDVRAEGYDA